MTPGMSCPCAMRPQPIWPTRMRLLAPQAREEMMRGAVAAVSSTLRRDTEILLMTSPHDQEGRPSICVLPTKPYSTKSFVPECFDRIESRRLARWIQPEQHADARADGQRRHHDFGARDHGPSELLGQQVTQPDAEYHAQRAADGCEHQCLHEELRHDVRRLRADRHADADLACSFGDGHQHDVHDADAADHE